MSKETKPVREQVIRSFCPECMEEVPGGPDGVLQHLELGQCSAQEGAVAVAGRFVTLEMANAARARAKARRAGESLAS